MTDYQGFSFSDLPANQTVLLRACSVHFISSMPHFVTCLICGVASIYAIFHGIQVVMSGKRGKESILLIHYLFMQLQQQYTCQWTVYTINETFFPFAKKTWNEFQNSACITGFACEYLHHQIIFTIAWMRKQFWKQVLRTRRFNTEALWRCWMA